MAAVVSFSGEYDFSKLEQLRRMLGALEHVPDLVLDLSGVTFLDAAAAAEFAILRGARERLGLQPETLIASSAVQRVFDMTGLGYVTPKTLGWIDFYSGPERRRLQSA